MKVLHILSDIDYSGAEIMLYTAEKHFKNAGIETWAMSTGSKDIGPFSEKMEEIGIGVKYIPFSKSIKHFLEMKKFIKDGNFDTIHIHKESAFLWTALACRLTFQKHNIVRTIHNNFRYKGYLKVRRKLHHWIAQNLLGIKFISISEEVKNNEKSLYGTRSVLINNWTDTDRFNITLNGSEEERNKRKFTFVSVGECSEVKNHMAIIRLVRKLKDRGFIFQYIHLGKGPLEEAEIQLSKELDITDQVIFIGNDVKVDKYLTYGDYYLMPSFFEGLSISCAEAMSSGKVCIVNDAPGLRTMIKNNDTGFVVDFNDLDKVADVLLSIYQDPALKKRLAESARKYIVQNYSLENVKKQIEMYV